MVHSELSSVKERWLQIQNEIKITCQEFRRDSESVCLVAVSKLQNISKIQEAFQAGQMDFAENYIQEATEKILELQKSDIRWHLIGPLQTNKLNKAIGKFSLIHSVDSLKIAIELNVRCERNSVKQPVLLQLNLADETSKSGFSKQEFETSFSQLKNLRGLEIQGLMNMPPQKNPEPSFAELQNLANKHGLKKLSMGTSSDWKLAIKYGSTHIRIGTALFGERKA